MKEKIDFDKQFQNLRRVEAPPFLYTRISSKINKSDYLSIPAWKALAIAGCLTILAIINVAIIDQVGRQNNAENSSLEQHLFNDLNKSNQVYYE